MCTTKRDVVRTSPHPKKPIQNPYGHQKTSKNSYRQVTPRDNKKNLLSVGAQRGKPTKDNRLQQEKTPFEELVRMRSAVRIRPAAPGKDRFLPEKRSFPLIFVTIFGSSNFRF